MNRLLALIVLLAILTSAYKPSADTTTWLLEAAPVFIIWPLLLFLSRKTQFSQVSYLIATVHALILLAGAHYTYAEVPLGHWAQQAFDFKRNHFDRLGHFFQGFSPTFLLADLLAQKSRISQSRLFSVFLISFSLAFSAFYELIEWWSAIILGDGATDFLGSQGDPWDAQWDMFMALLGSLSALGLWRACASQGIGVKRVTEV